MKTIAKLDIIIKPILSLKEPTFLELIEASNKASVELENMLFEEYQKGYNDGKTEKVKELIKKN